MPQPFQHLDMNQFQNMGVDELKAALFRPAMPPNEIILNSKVAELSHFLVQNFRNEISSEEHIIDTAIRILKSRIELPNLEVCDATGDDSKQNDDLKNNL